MNTTIKTLSGRVLGLLATFVVMSTVHAEEWLPVTPEELQMKSEPKAPAAAAVFLYRQVDRDDNAPDEVVYERIKILTDEGRKYGNVEIPYVKEKEAIRSIKARTIRPDGSIAPDVSEGELTRAYSDQQGIVWLDYAEPPDPER